MAPPTDQFASPGNPDILWTEDQTTSKYPDAPANPSRSCILGLATANPENCYPLKEFGMESVRIFGYGEMPLANTFVDRICKHPLSSPKSQSFSTFQDELNGAVQ